MMALRNRFVGEGLGIAPVKLSEPYAPDSDFDSTVRIPIRQTKVAAFSRPPMAPAPAPVGAMSPVALGQPAPVAPAAQPQPQVQPPAPAPAPTPTAAPQPYDTSQLNFEGSTYKGEQPGTGIESKRGPGDYTPEELGYLKANLKLNTDQMNNLLEAYQAGDFRMIDSRLFGTEDSDQWRATQKALFQKLESLGTPLTKRNETGSQTGMLGQQVYNSAIERLRQVSAVDSREQDENILALLSSRGLLNSGIAARELTRLEQTRMQNLYEMANRLNEMLLTNELGRLTQRDLATLQADLQKRNNEAYLRLQQKLQQDAQPSGLAQIAGTAIGTALPFLLSKRAPGQEDEIGSRAYSSDLGSTPQVNQRGSSYRIPRQEPY